MASDIEIGKSVARLRGEMTQKHLAEEMRKRGHKWSQATVWSVEKGERPLRMTEASDLIDFLKPGSKVSILLRTHGAAAIGTSLIRMGQGEHIAEQGLKILIDEQRRLVDEIQQSAESIPPDTVEWEKVAWHLMRGIRELADAMVGEVLKDLSGDGFGESKFDDARQRAFLRACELGGLNRDNIGAGVEAATTSPIGSYEP